MPAPLAEPVPFLLLRHESGASASFSLAGGMGLDYLAAVVMELAPPGFHDRTEWLVVHAVSPREANWPEPASEG